MLTHEFIIFELENPEKKEEILLNLGEIERKMALEEGKKFGLIVSSEVISVITSEDYLISRFYQVSSRCNSVICCRISPKQKAQMVEIVRREDKSLITLAIGDGANDVNMIKSAHVGVGIIGVEGNQASRAADYSISHFSALRRLLLVHGRESYRKNSFVVCYNFYKNVLLVMPQFWYNIIIDKGLVSIVTSQDRLYTILGYTSYLISSLHLYLLYGLEYMIRKYHSMT